VLSIVCAVAFIAVGIAHSVQHFDGAVFTASNTTVSSTDDNSPDEPNQAKIALDHCFACAMIAMPVSGQAIVAHVMAAEPARRLAPEGVRPHPPATETRPPIFAI